MKNGFPDAIAVCKDAAPALAAEIAESEGVSIGRTSFKLRNGANRPPAWAEGLVESRVEDEKIVIGPDGSFGFVRPIRMKAMCTNCHGTDAQRHASVDPVLAELYPDDTATGFDSGDLRGWFWVEVSAAAVEGL